MSDDAERERARYEALSALVDNYRRERDEARAELSKLREDYDSVLEANVGLLDGAPYVDARAAFRRGAEAMREACVNVVLTELSDPWYSDELLPPMRALPIPEEP